MDDLISRRAAIDALKRAEALVRAFGYQHAIDEVQALPSAQPERMTNKQWIDFLSAQFDISRTSAKEMLHGMMRWNKRGQLQKDV